MQQSLTIYKASAGSGKTFTLAVEYIVGLLQKGAEREFEHTLAVTFTNKATAEMKERILETLYGLKMGLAETKPYLDAIKKKGIPNFPLPRESQASPNTRNLEEHIRLQAGEALNAILHDYSHFRVETIDSFFQSILRGMARELGLAANLQVELSHDEIIDSAVDSLIETMGEKNEVKDWVRDYVREQLDSGDRWNIIGPLKTFSSNIFKEEYQRRSEDEIQRISDAEVIKAFKSKMQAIRNQAKKEVEEAVDKVMNLIPDFSQISYGKNLLSFLLKTKVMESDGTTKTTEAIKFKTQPSNATEIEEAYAQLLAIYPLRRKEYFSATLSLRHLNQLRLLQSIDQRAHEIEGDAGRFTLSSTPALLSKMIEGSDAPFIFEKIGTYINNVMIDEFQDTSLMQWENFKKLLFEKLASGGKGLLVGDIKQSIYRWRNGDWKILYGIEKEPQLRRFHIQPQPLDINHRSHQYVVKFNNVFFSIAARKLDTINPKADIKLKDIYSDVCQKPKNKDGKGFVRVTIFKETADYIQDTVVDMAEQIQGLQEDGLDLSQIAILVRTNLMAQQLIDGFSQYAPHINLVSDEAFLLEASVSIQMMVAAMRMLVDKGHTDIISEKYLMLHYLHDVLRQADVTIQSISLRNAEDVLPKEFTEKREELLQLPLYLLTEKLWQIFSLANIEGEDVYVLTFFDQLQNHLRSASAPDIQTFLTTWDEKLCKCAIPGSSVAGVRILTIHKSKGLAFHTVMLPFSHWDIEKDRQGDILWCSTDKPPYNELGTLPISIQSKAVRTSVFSPDYEEEHLERRVDALNTLYVAFTRAIANLYVWGKKGANTAGSLIYSTLRNNDNDTDENTFIYKVGSPLTETKTESKKENNRLHIEHRMQDAIDVKVVTRNPALYFLQSNQAQDYLKQVKNEESEMAKENDSSLLTLSLREVGKRMHEVLSHINDVSQLDEALSQARQENVIGKNEEWDAIITHIKKGLNNPLVASWFSKKNTVYNECAIASINKETGLPQVLRPDRVVMNEGSITVIDYKFGHPSRHYHDQVKEYMNLMKQMYPQHDVQGYIWYIMGKGAVKVAPSSNLCPPTSKANPNCSATNGQLPNGDNNDK